MLPVAVDSSWAATISHDANTVFVTKGTKIQNTTGEQLHLNADLSSPFPSNSVRFHTDSVEKALSVLASWTCTWMPMCFHCLWKQVAFSHIQANYTLWLRLMDLAEWQCQYQSVLNISHCMSQIHTSSPLQKACQLLCMAVYVSVCVQKTNTPRQLDFMNIVSVWKGLSQTNLILAGTWIMQEGCRYFLWWEGLYIKIHFPFISVSWYTRYTNYTELNDTTASSGIISMTSFLLNR